MDFRPLVGQTVLFTPAAIETGGEVSRIEITIEGMQSGPPAHVHPAQRERYQVLEGELTLKLNGRRIVLGPGEEMEIPVGATHTFANTTDQPVVFNAEHLPALRFEEYMRAVHAVATAPGAGGRRDPRTLLRIIRVESGYPETIRPPAGIPRLVVGAMNGLGRLLGYPDTPPQPPSRA